MAGSLTRRLIPPLALLATLLAGCVVSPSNEPQRPQKPPLPPQVETLPRPEAPPPAAEQPAMPESQSTPPAPSAEVLPPPEPPRVAALLSSRLPDYENIALALADEIERLDVYDLADKSLAAATTLAELRAAGTDAVVAIGYRVATVAAALEAMPVVYTQVFNAEGLGLNDALHKGVSVLPPLDLQLAAWRRLNPDLDSVGAVIGAGHDELLREARAAAGKHGVRFDYRIAQTDREMLYQFARLATDIDGYWLFPDNRILSGAVLRDLFREAADQGVQVAVFNDSLLPLGATLSATSVPADVAAVIASVLERLMAGEADEMPHLSPLSEIALRSKQQEGSSVPLTEPAT